MNGGETAGLLRRLSEAVECRSIALRCDCENLETVYVKMAGSGVVVTDDSRTFRYLQEKRNATYLSSDRIDMDEARRVCSDLGVCLVDAPPDGYPRVEYTPDPGETLSTAVSRVAEAVDRLFNLAIRDNLKRK